VDPWSRCCYFCNDTILLSDYVCCSCCSCSCSYCCSRSCTCSCSCSNRPMSGTDAKNVSIICFLPTKLPGPFSARHAALPRIHYEKDKLLVRGGGRSSALFNTRVPRTTMQALSRIRRPFCSTVIPHELPLGSTSIAALRSAVPQSCPQA
jgi:hypothetical protein